MYGSKTENLRLKLTLSCLDGYWTLNKRRQVARWLDCNKFAQFYTAAYPERWYYLTYIGGIDLLTNGIEQGYLEVEFENISPYSYSPVYMHQFNFSTITSPTIFTFENLGDSVLKPELWIKKIGTGIVRIKNLSDGGSEFLFVGLADKETIYVNNNNRHIESDLGIYRYDNFNNNYLELIPYSVNRLEVDGQCELSFKYQFALKG